MYHVKNLTNSPYRITTADGGFGVLMARGEGEFDIHPNMLNSYKQLGFMVISKVGDNSFAEPSQAEAEDALDELPEADEKEQLIAELSELGVKADKRSSVEKLQEKLDEALAK